MAETRCDSSSFLSLLSFACTQESQSASLPKDPDTPPLRSCLGEGGLCEGGQANQDSLSLSHLSFSFLGTDECAHTYVRDDGPGGRDNNEFGVRAIFAG